MDSRVRVLFLLLCAGAFQRGAAQGLGSSPPLTFSEADIYSVFGLPPLQDAAGTAAQSDAASTQVYKRAQTLGLTSQSALNAWQSAQIMIAVNSTGFVSAGAPTLYSGTTASGLNQLLANPALSSIRVTASSLAIDQPIEIRRSEVSLDLGAAAISSASAAVYMLRVENATNVSISNGDFISGDSAILVNDSQHVSVTDIAISNLTGAGIVVTGSQGISVTQNRISSLQLCGIMIHRGTTSSYVARNSVTGDLGSGNLMAGIVLTDREVDVTINPRNVFQSNLYDVIEQPMMTRIHPPHDNVLAFNHVSRNSAGGIYSDGGVRNVIAGNSIQGNAKEGMCLDNGSTANVVVSNVVLQNGDRWGESDAIMALESISGGGRNPDGTPAEKVPGISLDNALYNIVFMNNLAHNFGGGVKIVRTGYFNAIGLNTLLGNNDGVSATQHFFGIELGNTPADSPAIDLDFTPSHGNIVFSNVIRGSHYSGIFLDLGSDQNDVIGNAIEDATDWALESAQQMSNDSLNNLTHLPSRNIGSGLQEALIQSGQPVNDPPAGTAGASLLNRKE